MPHRLFNSANIHNEFVSFAKLNEELFNFIKSATLSRAGRDARCCSHVFSAVIFVFRSKANKLRYVCWVCSVFGPVRLLNQCNSIIYVVKKAVLFESCPPNDAEYRVRASSLTLCHLRNFPHLTLNGRHELYVDSGAQFKPIGCRFRAITQYWTGIKLHGVIFAPN